MKNILLTIIIFACIACSKSSVKIEGHLANIPNSNIYLAILDSNLQQQNIDTTSIVEGNFTFDNCIDIPIAECVIIKIGDNILPIFMGNENVIVSGDILKPDEIKINGSEWQTQMTNFNNNIPEKNELRRLQIDIRHSNNDIDKKNAIIEEIKNIQEEQIAYIKKFINKNKQNPIGLFCLLNSIQYYPFEELDSIAQHMINAMPTHKYIIALKKYIDIKRIEYEALKKLEIGKIAPDFELLSSKGKYEKLSSYRGKIILLDFWASWCTPCRENNKRLVDIYKKFSNKNFEIISVSLDTQKSKWENAIIEDKLPGILLLDSANNIGQIYCVNTIPCSYLLDADGKIISKDIDNTGEILNDIESLLNIKK